MPLEPFAGEFKLEQAVLLARRTMFGATKDELERFVEQGLQTTLEQLFSYTLEAHPDNPFMPSADLKDGEAVRFTQRRWLFEMLHTSQPFREKLALFWSNHFVIGVDKVRKSAPLLQYLETLYTYGLSSFHDLTLAVSKAPAMLRYLDNDKNKKANPNENFARELLELFTLGIGHYSEEDVAEAARAFTGWTYQELAENPTFVFNEKQHDTSSKTFLGQTGNWTGEDIIQHCAGHEATASFVSRKLWRGFVSDTVNTRGVNALTQTFVDSKGDLRVVLRELFSSQAFFESAGQRIKSPLEYVVGTLRSFGVGPREPQYYTSLQKMLTQLGQVPLAPPHVAGWSGGRSWIGDSTLLTRINVARTFSRKDRLFPEQASVAEINIALFGSETSPVDAHLAGLDMDERVFMLLVSPEYMVS